MTYCMIFSTCPDMEEAGALASSLVENRLAACVQLSPVTSIYHWDQKVCRDPEIRLIIKTKENLYQAVETHIKKHHSYDVPQIVRVPILGGLDSYLAWIDETARPAT